VVLVICGDAQFDSDLLQEVIVISPGFERAGLYSPVSVLHIRFVEFGGPWRCAKFGTLTVCLYNDMG